MKLSRVNANSVTLASVLTSSVDLAMLQQEIRICIPSFFQYVREGSNLLNSMISLLCIECLLWWGIYTLWSTSNDRNQIILIWSDYPLLPCKEIWWPNQFVAFLSKWSHFDSRFRHKYKGTYFSSEGAS